MTVHTPSTGLNLSYEEDKVYDLTVKSVELDEGKFGPQLKVVFELEGSDHWEWMGIKLGKHQGRVSKLRGFLNALAGHPEGDEVTEFNDETFAYKVEGDNVVHHIRAGANVRCKGEFFEDRFKLTRFKSVHPAPKPKESMTPKELIASAPEKEKVDPAAVPF